MIWAAARRADQEALLNQIGLVDELQRVAIFSQGRRERVDADRAAVEPFDHRQQDPAIAGVEAGGVDLQSAERVLGDVAGDAPVTAHDGEVADAAQQAVAMRGVPRARRPISSAPASSIGISRRRADRRTIVVSSSAE